MSSHLISRRPPVADNALLAKGSCYSQVIICLCAGLLLAPVDHDHGDGHADDEADGHDASEDPENTARGAPRHRFFYTKRGKKDNSVSGRTRERNGCDSIADYRMAQEKRRHVAGFILQRTSGKNCRTTPACSVYLHIGDVVINKGEPCG